MYTQTKKTTPKNKNKRVQPKPVQKKQTSTQVNHSALPTQTQLQASLNVETSLITQLKQGNSRWANAIQRQSGFEKTPPVQKKANKTGLPDSLKSGIENLSGYAMDDVKVHYNSHQPAQFQAHAYTQGTSIHVAPGQEKHLAHEAWHVVQQKQGRVKPTMQLKRNIPMNDDVGLEREADIMGAKALSAAVGSPTDGKPRKLSHALTLQQKSAPDRKGILQAKMQANNFREFVAEQMALQTVVKSDPSAFKEQYTTAGFEHEFSAMSTGALRGVSHVEIAETKEKMPFTGLPFILETDAQNALEFVSPPFLIETLLGIPLPDPDEIGKVDRMIQKTLDAHVKTNPSIGLLIKKFADNPGIHFEPGNIPKDETGDVEIRRENMTPNTTEQIGGSPISEQNNRLSKDDLLEISLEPFGNDEVSTKGSTTHVNFATDAQVYDLMQETYTAKGDAFQQYFLGLETDIKGILYNKLFKQEIADSSEQKENVFKLITSAKDKTDSLMVTVRSKIYEAENKSSSFGLESKDILKQRKSANENRERFNEQFDALIAKLRDPRASFIDLQAVNALLTEVETTIDGYNTYLGNDNWLYRQIDGPLKSYQADANNAKKELEDFPLIGEKTDKKMKIFLNALARTLSGQIGTISQLAVRDAQIARYADPDSPMSEDLIYDQFLSSRVKDVKQVWIKDTIMNIGLGLLGPADWARLKEGLKGGYVSGGIKRKLAKYTLPPLMDGEEEIPLLAKQFNTYVNNAVTQIITHINTYKLDVEGESVTVKSRMPRVKDKTIKKPSSIGAESRPALFDDDRTDIGARQDTYIPSKHVQMPDIWDRRLHVVESRKDSVERLRAMKEFYESDSSKKLSFSPVGGFDYTQYLSENLEEGAVDLGNGYVLTAAQAQALDEDNLENVNTTPDGDCLFNSLITVGAFNGSVNELRGQVADAVADGTVDVAPFMLDPVATARDIRTPGSYNNLAGDVTPSIIARILNIKILIYNEDGSTTSVAPPGGGSAIYRVIRFLTPGAHYHATQYLPPNIIMDRNLATITPPSVDDTSGTDDITYDPGDWD